MPDYAAQRTTMVATQLRTNDVTDARLRAAMATIPRELFVPEAVRPIAYVERCVALGGGRVLLDPRSFSKLVQLAAIRPNDVVLDVGCGTGYSAAVLAMLADRIIALEENPQLAARAEENLKAIGANNVRVIKGALPQGCREHAPFDAVVLNGAIESEPAMLLSQLQDGGRLVAIARDGAAGHAQLYVKHDGAIGERSSFDAQAPVLPGFEKPRSFVF